MALLPPEYLDAIVALGVPDSDNPMRYSGTGFLYGHPTGETDENGKRLFTIFLVTNRHVVEGTETLVARFNRTTNAESKKYPIPLRNSDNSMRWIVHPDPNCDVAVIPIVVEQLEKDGIYYKWFQGDDQNTLSVTRARELQVSEGDGVFVLGFPLGLAGEERNYTIVRQGGIARIRDWLDGNSRTFLVDASVFPGNSGGPVIIKPESTAINGTKANHTARLIGMVSAYLPYEDVAISVQTKKPRVLFSENSGLGVVVPMDVIQETVSLVIGKGDPDNKPKDSAEELPEQVKSASRKPLGQWLVDNMPRGTNLEIPSRQESGREIPFIDSESP